MTDRRTDPPSRIRPAFRGGFRKLRVAGIGALVLATTMAAPLPASGRVEELSFESVALGREMKAMVVRPASGGERPVLLLLHGRGRHRNSLLELADARESLLAADLWVFLPDGEDGWYMNSPVDANARYADYLDEIIERITARYPVPHESGRWAVAGWSMGGYGAIRLAQRRPERFGAVAAIIGLLDFPRAETLPPGRNYTVPTSRFGADFDIWSGLNPIRQVETLKGKAVLVITAEDAFDRLMNENFSQALESSSVPHEFVLLPGAHTLDVVRHALPRVLAFVRSATNASSRP